MAEPDLQAQCELGQEQLMAMRYLEAEATLVAAEKIAWDRRDFDTLARLYMPLQEARRQRRQRCGEGMICLDLLARGPADHLDGEKIVEYFPHGQLLVAGWGSIEPALRVRDLQTRRGLYVETFLGAVYPMQSGRVVVIMPLPEVRLPEPREQGVDALLAKLPAQCVVLSESELPHGSMSGNAETYGRVMALWEKLHTPFLAAADMQVDPIQKIETYRKTIRVDYACELAHQKLADVARDLGRAARPQAG